MTRKSMVDEIEEDPKRAPGFYAAELSMNIQMLLGKALESRPDLTVADIAETLGLTEDRVRWAYSLNDPDDIPEGMSYTQWQAEHFSNGNMHVASLARFMRVLGYKLEIKVVAVDENTNEEFVNTRRRRKTRAEHQKENEAKGEE